MGTTYHIVAITNTSLSRNDLKNAIEAELDQVNKHLSNWDEASELSRFNRSKSLKAAKISDKLNRVMVAANEVHEKSGGAFDVTLSPLINLWGFGPRKPETPLPAEEKIKAALQQVGQQTNLDLDTAAPSIAKLKPGITINLSAIAKGFGVDEVASILKKHQIKDFMVEIGGDLYASGTNPSGKPWRIGIEKPLPDNRSVQQIISLTNVGMATSGDYRNYFEQDDIRYSHIINAKTGYPIKHKTASVTVIENNSMFADAWATALLVLGERAGMKVAEEHELAAYFIFRSPQSGDKKFSTSMSPKFAEILNRQ